MHATTWQARGKPALAKQQCSAAAQLGCAPSCCHPPSTGTLAHSQQAASSTHGNSMLCRAQAATQCTTMQPGCQPAPHVHSPTLSKLHFHPSNSMRHAQAATQQCTTIQLRCQRAPLLHSLIIASFTHPLLLNASAAQAVASCIALILLRPSDHHNVACHAHSRTPCKQHSLLHTRQQHSCTKVYYIAVHDSRGWPGQPPRGCRKGWHAATAPPRHRHLAWGHAGAMKSTEGTQATDAAPGAGWGSGWP
jgi:hypothetical protein